MNEATPLTFSDDRGWASWLSRHHARASFVWVVIAKKGSKRTWLGISDALDVALCFGWVDSHRKGHDDDSFLQRYSPRRAKSPWSKLNVERVEALVKAGRMRAAGLAQVAAAKADGRWAAAYASQRSASPPPDFIAALAKNARAGAAFERLDKTGQYTLLLPVLKAVTAATRARRLEKALERLTEPTSAQPVGGLKATRALPSAVRPSKGTRKRS